MTSTVSFRELKATEWHERLNEIGEQQWKSQKEFFMKDGKNKYKLDLTQIFFLEDQGAYRIIGAFKGEELIGYMMVVMNYHIHHRGRKSAFTTSFYIKPEHRGGTGTKLIKFTEELLKNKYHVSIFSLVTNINMPMKNYIESLDYKLMDYVFMKEL